MSHELYKGRHRQQVELLREQNQVTEEKIAYLRDMDKKLKQITLEWKKAEDKNEVIKQIQNLLFKKKEHVVNNKLAKKVEGKYTEIKAEVEVGSRVKLRKNFQVGEVKELRGKRAIVQVGAVPISVDLNDLVVVEEKESSSS
jgi:DNA mismatch repair protein MutS2